MMHKVKQLFAALLFGVSFLLFTLIPLNVASISLVKAQATGTIRYVAPNGVNGSNACTSSTQPCATIQHAVDMAAPGDEIRVAAGTYTGVSSREGMVQMVYVTKAITIRGGYTVNNWNTPAPQVQPSILDAQAQGRVMVITGTITATVEGLQLTRGRAFPINCGGLCVVNATVTARNNTIFNNSDNGVFVVFGEIMLVNNTIFSNTAESGGGVYLTTGRGTLVGNTISHNHAEMNGGGIEVEYVSIVDFADNVVVGNTAGGSGGGLHLSESEAELTNTLIVDNEASMMGSGLYLYDSSARLQHTTLARNRGGDGSGIYLAVPGDPSTIALTNTILTSHTVGIVVEAGNSADLEATLWGSGSWANGTDWAGSGNITTGTVNIWADPGFIDPQQGNYHLIFGSAALDQGLDVGVTTDIDGESRPYGGGYDLGADEGQPSLTLFKTAETALGRAGKPLTYSVWVTNTGYISLTTLITDILPEHVTPTNIISWAPSLISLGDSWTEQIVVTVETGYIGPLTNVVQATSAEGATGSYTHTLLIRHTYYFPIIFKHD